MYTYNVLGAVAPFLDISVVAVDIWILDPIEIRILDPIDGVRLSIETSEND